MPDAGMGVGHCMDRLMTCAHHAHTVNDLLPREYKLTSLESVAAIRPDLSHDFIELMQKSGEKARISIQFRAQ